MAKIKYDVANVEERSGERPKPGLYECDIEEVEHRTNRGPGKDDDLKLSLRVVEEGEFKGAPLWAYVGFGESQDWKLKEFVKAIGLKDKGEIDTDKIKGKHIMIKVVADSYEGEYQAKVGRFLALGDGGDDDDPDADIEPAAADATEDDPQPPAAGAFVPSRESDPEVGSYDNWVDEDLEGEVTDRGLTLPGGRGKKRDKFIAALRADDPDDDAADAAETNGGASADDYDQWTLADLVDEVKNKRQLDMPAGRKTEEKLIAVLREDDDKPAF